MVLYLCLWNDEFFIKFFFFELCPKDVNEATIFSIHDQKFCFFLHFSSSFMGMPFPLFYFYLFFTDFQQYFLHPYQPVWLWLNLDVAFNTSKLTKAEKNDVTSQLNKTKTL